MRLLSWNWPAFFCTLAWLRHRKLYAWSWLYFFVSTPMLLYVLAALQPPSPCEGALAGPGLKTGSLVVYILIAAGFVLPPLFADRIDDARLKSPPPEKRTGTGGSLGALILQAGVLAMLLATTNFENQIARSRVSAALSTMSALEPRLGEYLRQQGRLPASIADLGAAPQNPYVERIVVERDGVLRATFNKDARELAGHTVSLVPRIAGDRVSSWSCRSDDLPQACVPFACRH